MKKRLVVSFTLIILLLNTFLINCFAEDIEDLNELYNKQNEIQEQKNDATTKLEIVQSDMSATLQQVQELTENINIYQVQVDELDKNIIELEDSIINLESKLEKAEKDYEIKKKAIDTRLVAMYEAGETQYLDVLLNSKSLSDLISNYYLLSVITEYDTNLLIEIEENKKNIKRDKTSLENNKKEISKKREEKETTAIILQNSITMKNFYMAQLSEEERRIQEDIELYQAQLNEIEEEIMSVVLANLGPEYIGGVMAWPVPGYTIITSQYGMRTHPITGIYKLHTGVDLRAPVGANFIAANAGIVIKVSEGGAYGKMVMIDHGGGVSTLYAHGSEILVELGQTVNKGTPVLKVGNTGYSTGPHAHFEVRVNGFPVNPMPYITNTNPENMESNDTE